MYSRNDGLSDALIEVLNPAHCSCHGFPSDGPMVADASGNAPAMAIWSARFCLEYSEGEIVKFLLRPPKRRALRLQLYYLNLVGRQY